MQTDRRRFIQTALAAAAASAVISPDRALAGAAPANWLPAVADVDSDVPLQTLKRIDGRAPADFAATLFRNGPAKFRRGGRSAGHWFDGDGLLRRFRVDAGQATLVGRFVETPKRQQETALDAIVVPGFGTARDRRARINNPDDANAANTSVMMLGGELLALWEGGSATRMQADDLATLGIKTFRRDLKHMPFSAHPRVDPDGTVWNFGGNGKHTAIWQIARDGSLKNFALIDVGRQSYFHDFSITARHLIIVLQPWLQEGFSFPIAQTMKWRPEQGTQILVIDKDDLNRRRTYELPAFSAFHYGDGWEEKDGTIRFDGCLGEDPTFGQISASAMLRGEYVKAPEPRLTQIVLHPGGKAAMLDTGLAAEFPVSDRRRSGLQRRLTVHVGSYGDGPLPHGLGVWDWVRGREDRFHFGEHQLVEEFQYVPGGHDERDGWLMGTTLNLKANATELHLLRANAVVRGPVVSWRADRPLPVGFHGTIA